MAMNGESGPRPAAQQELDQEIRSLLKAHEQWRSQCVNLVASENALSPYVRNILDNDLLQRYADYEGRHLSSRKYQGTRWVEKIEALVTDLALEVFDAKYAELRPISGHLAGSAVIMGVTKPGNRILEVDRKLGGHRLAYKLGLARATPLNVHYLPIDPFDFNIDVDKTAHMIRELKPTLVILGSSNFLFSHPVAEIAEILNEFPDTCLAYDASHVFGLIAGGRFQDPLKEGAHIVFGSSHKTLPGPQGGLIFSNNANWMDAVSEAVYPALVTNHHPFRLPGLGIALLEMKKWGSAYADQIVANSQNLAAEIQSKGVEVVLSRDGRFTESHTILIKAHRFGSAREVSERLEQANIIANGCLLPEQLGSEGIRIGVQEITRLGAKRGDMAPLSSFIVDCITETRPASDVARDVEAFSKDFRTVHFTWRSEN